MREGSVWFNSNPWILYIVLPFISRALLLHAVLAYAIAHGAATKPDAKTQRTNFKFAIRSTRITLLLSRAPKTYANVCISFTECIRWKFTPNHAKCNAMQWARQSESNSAKSLLCVVRLERFIMDCVCVLVGLAFAHACTWPCMRHMPCNCRRTNVQLWASMPCSFYCIRVYIFLWFITLIVAQYCTRYTFFCLFPQLQFIV